MDSEDFGKNNPPFQRYIPSCYGKYQRYIPSIYLTGKDALTDKDNEQVCMARGAVKITGIPADQELAAVV